MDDDPDDPESAPKPPAPETDDRFPSGRWIGFYLQKSIRERQSMELILQFSGGVMQGEGRDPVGDFLIRGRYQTEDGRCHWHKRYIGQHDVFYRGFNEGKGIWGVWEIRTSWFSDRDGFRIWPEGMADPTQQRESESVEPPVSFDNGDDSLSGEPLTEDVEESVSPP